MTQLRALVVAFNIMALAASGSSAQSVSVIGTVRNAQGTPTASTSVLLNCEDSAKSPIIAQAKTGADGAYSFADLRPLPCRLRVTQGEQTTVIRVDLTGAQPGQVVRAPDLVLGSSATSPAAQAGTALNFEASGIRGLIDPGGYSAPATAAAASRMLSDIANVRREDSFGVFAGARPCAAEPALLQAVREHPDDLDAKRLLGEFYMSRGMSATALPYLTRAHQASPNDIHITLELAHAQIAQEQFASARAVLMALPASVHDPQLYSLLAKAAEGLGLFAEAAAQYHLADVEDPSVDNTFSEAYELILTGRLTAAAEVISQGLTRFPSSVRLLIGKGTTEYLEGHSADAVATFLEAVQIAPADPQPYPFLAQAYVISGEQADRVRAVIKHHLDTASNDGEAYYLDALVLSRREAASTGGDVEVEPLLKTAIALDPSLALAHLLLGIQEARRDDDQEAAHDFEETLRIEPSLNEVHFRLAMAYRNLGQKALAAHEMEIYKKSRTTDQTPNDALSFKQFISVRHREADTTKSEVCAVGPIAR